MRSHARSPIADRRSHLLRLAIAISRCRFPHSVPSAAPSTFVNLTLLVPGAITEAEMDDGGDAWGAVLSGHVLYLLLGPPAAANSTVHVRVTGRTERGNPRAAFATHSITIERLGMAAAPVAPMAPAAPAAPAAQPTPWRPRRRLLDEFAASLRAVDALYTKHFGRAPRFVIAHMPHLVDRAVVEAMQRK